MSTIDARIEPLRRNRGWGGCLKTGLIVLGALVALGALAVFLVLKATQPLADVADRFFSSVAAADMNAAGAFLSAEFKKETPPDRLAAFLKNTTLADYQSATWNSREIENDKGKLEGSAKTKSGGVVPLKIDLIKESGVWKIYHISLPEAGLTQERDAKLPARPENFALIQQTTAAFAEALRTGDFGPLHRNAALEFQRQIPVDQLAAKFQEFIDKKADLGGLKKVEPLLTADPAMDKDGILTLEGRYPSTPMNVKFKYKYLRRDGTWQLLGINVHMIPAEEP